MSIESSMLNHPAGKGIAESHEVAQHRMDLEAVALANSNHKRSRVPDWIVGALLGVFVYAVIAGLSLAALMVGGGAL